MSAYAQFPIFSLRYSLTDATGVCCRETQIIRQFSIQVVHGRAAPYRSGGLLVLVDRRSP